MISAGLFLSVVHNHGHEDHLNNGIDHQISQDITECAICASHFKFSSDTELTSTYNLFSEVTLLTNTLTGIIAPLNDLQKGRAPPAKG